MHLTGGFSVKWNSKCMKCSFREPSFYILSKNKKNALQVQSISSYHLVTNQKSFCKKQTKKSSFCLWDVMSDFIFLTSGCVTSASIPHRSQTNSQNTAALTNFFGASISSTLTNWSHIEDDASQMSELVNLCYLCEKNTDKFHDPC